MSLRDTSGLGRTGFKFENIDFSDDAAIAMTKFGTRTLQLALDPSASYFSGTSVAISVDSNVTVLTLPDANDGLMYFTFKMPAEMVVSGSVTIDIYWKTTAITGDVYLESKICSATTGEATTVEDTQTTTSPAPTTSGQIKKSTITHSTSIMTQNDWIGLLITRYPANAADTLGADIKVLMVVFNYTGRA